MDRTFKTPRLAITFLVRLFTITLCFGAMAILAYGFGRVTRSDWVWWLAPLTVAIEGSLLFRAGIRGGVALLSLSEVPIFRYPGVPIYLVSTSIAAGVVAWGAYTGNRLTLLIGTGFAILGAGVRAGEEPGFERNNEPQ